MDDYNFDLLEDMKPMVFVPGGNPSGFDRRNEYKTYLYDGNDAVFLSMIRLWIVNVGLGGNIVLRRYQVTWKCLCWH